MIGESQYPVLMIGGIVTVADEDLGRSVRQDSLILPLAAHDWPQAVVHISYVKRSRLSQYDGHVGGPGVDGYVMSGSLRAGGVWFFQPATTGTWIQLCDIHEYN
jgi:hypothetical protein